MAVCPINAHSRNPSGVPQRTFSSTRFEILPCTLILALLLPLSTLSAQDRVDPPSTRLPEPELLQGSLFVKIQPAKRPWGVIFEGGSMYVAGNNFDIDRISPSGQVTRFSRINPDFVGPGMAFDSAKNLLIADGKLLLSIDRAGKCAPLLAGFTRALDLQIDPRGNLLVADDIEGRVYSISPGPNRERRVLIDRHLAPMWFALTSIALDAKGENLYLAESISGRIIKYPLSPQGMVGEPEVIAEKLIGLRFLAIDASNNVYASSHFPVLVRIDRNKQQRRFFVTNLEDPAGMAFGKQGFDPKALYISNRYGITKVIVPGL